MTRTAVLCDGVRTPIGRFDGGLAQVRPDDLAALAIAAAVSAFGGASFVETAGPQPAPQSSETSTSTSPEQAPGGAQTQSARWN